VFGSHCFHASLFLLGVEVLIKAFFRKIADDRKFAYFRKWST